MLTLVLLFFCLQVPCFTFRLQHSLPNMNSHFASDAELREIAETINAGFETRNVEMIELQETRDLDSTILNFHSENRQLSLRIKPTLNLIKPNAMLQIIDENSTQEEEINPILRSSFYHGHVDDEHRGSVALARTTRGWTGLIETYQDKYVVHKVPEAESNYLLMRIDPTDFVDLENDFIMTEERLSQNNFSYEAGDTEESLRNVENELEMEVGVFTDYALFQRVEKKYPGDNVLQKMQEIILIILNTVHAYFQKPSIGNRISIVIATIAYSRTKPDEELPKKKEIRKYLTEFCKWNHRKNTEGKHYDVGVKFTGFQLYDVDPKKTKVIGMAPVGGACNHKYAESCVISEARNYLSAIILAHELGHNLGMSHDGTGNTCNPKKFIMGPRVSSGITDFSSCSRESLKKYIQKLDKDGINCLRETGDSMTEHSRKGLLPGERIPKGDQCRLIVGEGFTEKSDKPNFCLHIACQSSFGGWQSSYQAPLPGTPCGFNKVCYDTICQERAEVLKIIASYQSSQRYLSDSVGEKLSLNELCEKYVPGYPIGVDHEWNRNNGFKYDLSYICSENVTCYSATYDDIDTYEGPAPAGTKCADGKVCEANECR